MRKVIVSGGNGFVGSSLVRRLCSMGVEVHAIVNQNHQRLDSTLAPERIHELHRGVGSAVEIVRRVEPDTIFHLAAVYSEPASAECILSMLDGNLTLGTCLLFAATQCASCPVFVNTGTYWQFDAESHYSPNTLYAATKQAFQDVLLFYRMRLGVRSTTLILYDTFGEQDTRRKLWQRLTTAAAGNSISLSEGEQTIHLLHIEDTVSAFTRAANLLRSEVPLETVYSVSSGEPVRLRTLVESLNAEAQLGLDLRWGAAPYWEGQVLDPWVGTTLPGWRAEIKVLPALVEMARRHRAGQMANAANAGGL